MTDKRERLREELTPQEVAEYAVWYARKVKGPADKVAAALLEEFPWLREPLEAAALAHDLPMGIRGGDDDEDQYAALAVDRPSGSGLKEAVKHFLEAWPNIVNHPRYDNVEVAALRAALSGSSDPEAQCSGYAGDPGASAPRCESYAGHPGRHFIRPFGSSDPEAVGLDVGALRSVVEQAARMGSCSQTHHEWIAKAAVAALTEAKPETPA